MRLAIFSSWHHEISRENRKLARDLGRYLHTKGVTVVTGGCAGIPALVVEEASRCGAETVGYFPHQSSEEHAERQHEKNNHSLEYYSRVFFISGFTARSLEMIKSVDAALVLNGRIGTLSEFSIAVEEGLPLAVLEGTGGVADELRRLVQIAKKNFSEDLVLFETNYRTAIDKLVTRLG